MHDSMTEVCRENPTSCDMDEDDSELDQEAQKAFHHKTGLAEGCQL